jgi:hypothetical protein
MFLTMSEIMLKIIALSFKSIGEYQVDNASL